MVPPSAEMRLHLNHVVNALVNETKGGTPRDHIASVVDESYEEIAEHAKIETFLPILTLRHARSILMAQDYASGKRLKDFTGVLVACRSNRGRSQAAAALFRFYAPGLLLVLSAGTAPAEEPRERVVTYLREHGVELTDYPKRVRSEYIDLADHVVILQPGVDLPLPQGTDVEFWDIPELTSQMSEEDVEAILRDVDDHVRVTLARIQPDLDFPPSIFEARV